MIYGGFAYADYLQYSTAVREAARDIALQKANDSVALAAKRQTMVDNLNGSTGLNYVHPPLTKLYKARFSAEIEKDKDPNVVLVGVDLTLDVNVIVLPEKLGPLQCAMPLEPNVDTSTGGTETP